MRRILLLLGLLAAACPPPPAPTTSARDGAAPASRAPAAAGRAEEPAAAPVRALVPHLAPGDPVTLALRFDRDVGDVTRLDPLEVALDRPDGTVQRARTAVSVTPASTLLFDLPAADSLDLALAGRYRLSLAGVAQAASHRFVTREIELEVMGDGRLPLTEIERRARRELERRVPGASASALIAETEQGDRRVHLILPDGAIHVITYSPAGKLLEASAGGAAPADPWLLLPPTP